MGYLIHHDFFLSVDSVQLQQPREAVQVQHGAVQAVGAGQRRRLPQLQAQHGRSSLSLLQGGVLPRRDEADDAQEGLQT